MAIAGKMVDLSSTIGKVVMTRGEASLTIADGETHELSFPLPYDCYIEKALVYVKSASNGFTDVTAQLKVGDTGYSSAVDLAEATVKELSVSSTYRNTKVDKTTVVKCVVTNGSGGSNTLTEVVAVLRVRPANIADGIDGNLWINAE